MTHSDVWIWQWRRRFTYCLRAALEYQLWSDVVKIWALQSIDARSETRTGEKPMQKLPEHRDAISNAGLHSRAALPEGFSQSTGRTLETRLISPRLLLLQRAYIYYRLHGLRATLQKVYRRARGAEPSAATQTFGLHQMAYSEDRWSVPFSQDEIIALGPITADRVFAQEVRIDADELVGLELFLATYGRRNTSRTTVALFSLDQRILHEEHIVATSVVDNSFYRLNIPRPIRLAQDQRFILVITSADGTADNCITAWKSPLTFGRLVSCPSGIARQAVVTAFCSDAPRADAHPLAGTVIYRFWSRARQPTWIYHWPETAIDIEQCWCERCARVALLSQRMTNRRRNGERFEGAINVPAHNAILIDKVAEAVRRLEAADLDVFFVHESHWSEDVKDLMKKASAARIPTVFVPALDTANDRRVEFKHEIAASPMYLRRMREPDPVNVLRACSFTFAFTHEDRRLALLHRKHVISLEREHLNGVESNACKTLARDILQAHRRLHRPIVSIVCLLYRKAAEIEAVLESYFRQTYAGEIELILVDDCSPDDSTLRAEQFMTAKREEPRALPHISVKCLRNERNLGNCISRNRGIAACRGDVIVVIDADCVVNQDFVKRHVEAHAFDDCEVVIGPMNIESAGAEPLGLLGVYEARPGFASSRAVLQDCINKHSFLNCVTRNFSIKASAITEDLFDPLFSYSEDPASGFGWEDVEMGYRLYRQGLRIKYVDDAISIHVSPSSQRNAAADVVKPKRSMLNFRRLFDKHPELASTARRWAIDTYSKICAWYDANGIARDEHCEHVSQLFRSVLGSAVSGAASEALPCPDVPVACVTSVRALQAAVRLRSCDGSRQSDDG